MANRKNNIPFPSLEKKQLETRIYALTMMYRAAERLQALSGKLKAEENEKICDAVISFITKAMGDNASPDEEAVIDKFPELMDLALVDNLDEQRRLAQKFLSEHQEIAFADKGALHLISEGASRDLTFTKSLKEIYTTVLDTTQNRKSAFSTEDLSLSLVTGDFSNDKEKLETTYKRLQQAKKSVLDRLVADWTVYKSTTSHKLDALKKTIEGIVSRVDVSHQNDFPKTLGKTHEEKNKNLSPRQKANRRMRGYFSESSGKLYNKDFPETPIKAKPSSKEQFLKLMGIFLHNGQNYYLSSISSNLTDYTKLKLEITRLYPDNAEETLNRILNVKNAEELSGKELEQVRQSNFSSKSRELYVKTLCAALENKKKTAMTAFDVNTFVQISMNSYIREMQDEGSNNILYISTINEYASSWKEVSDMKKDEFEKMTATVHHHRPIASTIDFYVLMHPKALHKNETLASLSEERFLALADKAQEYANSIGNHCLVFGSDVHDKLEAHGLYSITQNKESTVLACRYDYNEINSLLAHSHLDKKLLTNLMQDVEKFGKVKDKDGIIRASIDFPDHPDVEKLQKNLSRSNDTVAAQEIPNMFIAYSSQKQTKK